MGETLNIISESYCKGKIGGPNKVVFNTIKGLDIIGYPYVINKNIRNYKYNWIHDSQKFFLYSVINDLPVLMGPNLFVLPKDMPPFPKSDVSIYLHPSDWCVKVWIFLGFNKLILKHWPTGIDWESFNESLVKRNNKNVMVYYKERNPVLLDKALKVLENKGFIPVLLKYGFYNEDEFKNVLINCSFGVWLGRHESQGIALQEALASDLPLIVINATRFSDTYRKSGKYKFPKELDNFVTTSAPYFDNQCGIIIDSINNLDDAIGELYSNLSNYHPLKFIQDNLSLEKQAYQLIELLKEIDKNGMEKLTNKKYKLKYIRSLLFVLINSLHLLKRKSKTVFRIIFSNS